MKEEEATGESLSSLRAENEAAKRALARFPEAQQAFLQELEMERERAQA